MLRISRLTDYATMVLAHMAAAPDRLHTTTEVAAGTGLSQPTVSKLMKNLAKSGLLSSYRGAAGGYALARPAAEISAADVLDALEGPVTLTECSGDDGGGCEYEARCRVGNAWQVINAAIRSALEDISLPDLLSPKPDLGPLQLRATTKASETRDTSAGNAVPMHFRPRV